MKIARWHIGLIQFSLHRHSHMKIRLQLIVMAILRAILDTFHRMVYPFLSIFARGLGVDVTTLSFIIAARSFSGIFSPMFASMADQRGRKFGMLAGGALFILGVGLVAIHPSLLTFSIALVLGIFSRSMFGPAIQAYIGDRIAYEQRGT